VLGRQPVADGKHRRAAGPRERAAGSVVRIERADHPAAAMVVDHQRRVLARTFGNVEPRRDRPPGKVQRQVLDDRHGGRRPHLHRSLVVDFAQCPCGDRGEIDGRHLREHREQGFDLCIQRHETTLPFRIFISVGSRRGARVQASA
jgi:hypothetical protein